VPRPAVVQRYWQRFGLQETPCEALLVVLPSDTVSVTV